eukprot:sb/3467155/
MPLPVKEVKLTPPPLSEIVESFTRSLKLNFKAVDVSVVECPDLTEWGGIAAPGLGGMSTIADVGGVPNLIPRPKVDKEYSLPTIAQLCGIPEAVVIGPSAVASVKVGKNAELVNNFKVGAGNKSWYTRVTDETQDTYLCERYPHDSFGLLGNLHISQGLPGPVIKVSAKIRTGHRNFITTMNEGLAADFGEATVAVGGVFMLKEGKTKCHVMPGFSCTPIRSDDDVNKWLRFYEMSAPLVHTSVFVSRDPGLDLRLEHSHCFSEHGDGGHYHFDTTPDTVWYEGYFSLAERIVRIDAPEVTHQIGRD